MWKMTVSLGGKTDYERAFTENQACGARIAEFLTCVGDLKCMEERCRSRYHLHRNLLTIVGKYLVTRTCRSRLDAIMATQWWVV